MSHGRSYFHRRLGYSGVVMCGLSAFSAACLNVDSLPNTVVEGVVEYTDGSPAVGATVEATSSCPTQAVARRAETRAAADGSFGFPAIDHNCGIYEIVAHQPERFWLKTADQIFSVHGERTPLSVDTSKPRHRVKLTLDERGGRVRFRVLSRRGSEQSMSVLLTISRRTRDRERTSEEELRHGLTFETDDRSGSPAILLPAGEYILSAEALGCWERRFTVTEGSEDEVMMFLEPCSVVQEHTAARDAQGGR